MGTATTLWADNTDLARACRDHAFVRGIASGTLSRERFIAYVEQDAWFLTAFARGYAIALAKAPDLDTMAELRSLLEGVFTELQLHDGYAERWNASREVHPTSATSAYTDFLLRVAWSEPLGSILAAMTPCLRLYAYLGQAAAQELEPTSPYREWVDTYGGEEFEALAATLERLLDAHAPQASAVADHYRTAMQREFAFFDQV